MIVVFTDFGLEGPYLGQVKTVLWRLAPREVVIDLFVDAPACRPKEAAYLLATYAREFPPESVFLCVVDPGVGGDRPAIAVRTDGGWFVGPGNGLFEPLLRRASSVQGFQIRPPAGVLSNTFHGRDLFAPVAAKLACGVSPADAGLVEAPLPRQNDWPDDLAAIVYVDHFGNLMTGLRGTSLGPGTELELRGRRLLQARTFTDVAPGCPFWYINSSGLAEIAVNGGRAVDFFDALIGQPVTVWAGHQNPDV